MFCDFFLFRFPLLIDATIAFGVPFSSALCSSLWAFSSRVIRRYYGSPANTHWYVRPVLEVKKTGSHRESGSFRLSDIVQFSPALGNKHVYWLKRCGSGYRSHVRLQKGCQRLSLPATLSYLTFGKCHFILASQCLPIEVGVVSIIVCNCGWIPIEAKRNVGPLWLVASDELPVVRIIVGTSRGSRLLQTVMYSHFGGYDTSVNRKSPVIRFFLKFFMSTQ